MAHVDRYDAAYGIFVSRWVRGNLHTNIRAKVVSVNYDVPSVTVAPMAFTTFPSGTVDRYDKVFDVPLLLPSGGKGRLSMPIKAGDTVGLSFSERNEEDNTDEQTHGMFPGWAVTQIFTEGNSKPIDPENVVLENDKAFVTLKPSGDMSLVNDKVNIQTLADGNIAISNGTGNFIMDPSGMINANGAKITPTGRIITKEGIDLDDFYKEYLAHFHKGVERGDSETDPVSKG